MLSVRGARAVQIQGYGQSRRTPPTVRINEAYDAFLADFASVTRAYVHSLSEQSSGTASVSANLVQPYVAGQSMMVVDNASVFGPAGQFPSPVIATATINGVPTNSQFYITGSSGNTLILDPTQLSPVSLSPSGTVISANVSTSAQASAASIYSSFITNRTNQMAIDLVRYFNGLPVKLPYFNAPPRTPNNRGAIQSYVYTTITGGDPTSLQQSLLAIPLPTTPGSDLTIYEATVKSAVAQSRTTMLNGIGQVFSRKLLVPIAAPNNRFGTDASGQIPAYLLGTGTGTGTGTSS